MVEVSKKVGQKGSTRTIRMAQFSQRIQRFNPMYILYVIITYVQSNLLFFQISSHKFRKHMVYL